MKIKKLHIKNFKSIADLEIIEPNPFTVFVGPNGSGKSNIFEALEFTTISFRFPSNQQFSRSIFGETDSFLNLPKSDSIFEGSNLQFDDFTLYSGMLHSGLKPDNGESFDYQKYSDFRQFIENFSVVFPNNLSRERFKLIDDRFLSLSCSNLEKVLKRILLDEFKNEEISEWLDLFIPGFERVEVISSDLSSTDTLLMYEKGIKKPFTKKLISDGTYNILALLTAVFQSDEPQFLCIEEPENGLNPKVIKELVGLFRYACEEKGHYIWLNTHSQSLVSELESHEIILVNKKDGATQVKHLKKDLNLYGLPMDEAWLSNALGGGLPW